MIRPEGDRWYNFPIWLRGDRLLAFKLPAEAKGLPPSVWREVLPKNIGTDSADLSLCSDFARGASSETVEAGLSVVMFPLSFVGALGGSCSLVSPCLEESPLGGVTGTMNMLCLG